MRSCAVVLGLLAPLVLAGPAQAKPQKPSKPTEAGASARAQLPPGTGHQAVAPAAVPAGPAPPVAGQALPDAPDADANPSAATAATPPASPVPDRAAAPWPANPIIEASPQTTGDVDAMPSAMERPDPSSAGRSPSPGMAPAIASSMAAAPGAVDRQARPIDPAPPPLPVAQPAIAVPRPAFPAQPAVAAIPGHLLGLAAWAGCAPHCAGAIARSGQRLRSGFVLQFPPLRGELERMLGRRPLQDLLRIAETGPAVERRNDWVRIALCRQEACATEFMVLFVHLSAGEMVLCWHEERWDAPRLRWSENRGGVWRTGVAGRQALPPEGCNNRGPLHGHDWDLLRRLADG